MEPPVAFTPVFNQTSPQSTIPSNSLYPIFRTFPQYVVCPHCSQVAYTYVVKKISILSIVCACCYPKCWFIRQDYKAKDLNCYDASHYCMNCNYKMADYNSC